MALTIDKLCHLTITSALSLTILEVFSEPQGSTATIGLSNTSLQISISLLIHLEYVLYIPARIITQFTGEIWFLIAS